MADIGAQLDEDDWQDAIAWLEQQRVNGSAEASTTLEWVRAAESRENAVLGMLMAQRPAYEIRDYLLTRGGTR